MEGQPYCLFGKMQAVTFARAHAGVMPVNEL